MPNIYFWIGFFGAPLFVVLVTAYVFRPSARKHYHDAKQVIFTDDEIARRSGKSGPGGESRLAA